MAEALALAGRDVVIVYDDLTSHANVHRAIALLLGHAVGREAHPADIFYAHARLLERAAQFGASQGGGSLTAFPLVETQAGDLTAYIPTNLVSITDGQIRLDARLLAAGVTPAVDVGLSVSWVGGKAQSPWVRAFAGELKNRYAQFLELETFARFGTQLEASSQAIVEWGRRVRVVLSQPLACTRSWEQTIALLAWVQAPRFASLPLLTVGEATLVAMDALVRHSAFPTEVQRASKPTRDALQTLIHEDDAVLQPGHAALESGQV